MIHSTEFLEIVNDAKSRVREVSVDETLERMKENAVLIDVREDNEFDAGHAKDAIHLGRGIIERDIVEKFPDKNTELILYCGGGFRSALSPDMLQKWVIKMFGQWQAVGKRGARRN